MLPLFTILTALASCITVNNVSALSGAITSKQISQGTMDGARHSLTAFSDNTGAITVVGGTTSNPQGSLFTESHKSLDGGKTFISSAAASGYDARAFQASAVDLKNNLIYMMGGAIPLQSNGRASTPVKSQSSSIPGDTTKYTLTQAELPFAPRIDAAACVTPDTNIYLTGGTITQTNDFSTAQDLIQPTDVWQTGDRGQTWARVTAIAKYGARSGHVMFWKGDQMVVCGGYRGTRMLNDCFETEDQGFNWKEITNTPNTPRWAPRAHHSIAVSEQLVVLTGGTPVIGQTNGPLFSDVWASRDLQTWTLLSAQSDWSQRQRHASFFTPKGLLYVLGGQGTDGQSIDDVWASSVALSDAETTPAPAAPEPVQADAQARPAGTIFPPGSGGAVIVPGGVGGGNSNQTPTTPATSQPQAPVQSSTSQPPVATVESSTSSELQTQIPSTTSEPQTPVDQSSTSESSSDRASSIHHSIFRQQA
jgi:hypothetical protein